VKTPAPKSLPRVVAKAHTPTGSSEFVSSTFSAYRLKHQKELSSLEDTPAQNLAVTNKPANVGVLALSGQGGSGNVARACASGLAEAGHCVWVMTGQGGFWDGIDSNAHLNLSFVDAPQTPREPGEGWETSLGMQVADQAKRLGLDALWVHYGAGLLGAATRARDSLFTEGMETKVLATLHGTDVTNWGNDPKHRNTLREQLNSTDMVTAVSDWLADQTTEILGVDKPRVVPNALASPTFHPDTWVKPTQAQGVDSGMTIRRAIAPNGEVVFLHASNFRGVKRPLDVLDVFAQVRQSGVAAKLLLIGDSSPHDNPLMQTFYERALKLGVADDIFPLGPMGPEALARHYAASDFTLMTSESESFGLTILESMATGTPVLSSKSGGPQEILRGVLPDEHGESRLLAEVGDTATLAERALELIRDPKQHLRARLEGVKVARERYPVSTQMNGYTTVLDDVMAANSRKR
jgi:N-acetyl-alpha-D-glucosaminyl L-malate synthase BshA